MVDDIAYYLKFLDGVTKEEFRSMTRPSGLAWANYMLLRLRRKEWIEFRRGKWYVTQLGRAAYRQYLGLK